MPANHTVLNIFGDAIVRWRNHRAEVKTRRVIEGLPRQIRKDIGWPEALPDRNPNSGWLL
jgi:hypothetical protein